jgi:hypothetical protein
MSRNKPILLGALAGMLGVVTALSFAVGGGARGGHDLTIPSANMQLSKNWAAKPAAGTAARLPWANIRVNTDNSTEAQNEPFVAVNPSNSRHIVAGANNWLAGSGRYEVTAYVSFDGGSTWASSNPYIDRNAGRVNAADPTIAFGPNGEVYFAFIALNPALGAVAVSRSNDGGLTWASQSWATSFTYGADKPAVAYANGAVNVFFQNSALQAVSSADGVSWSAPVAIANGGRNAAPVVDAKGNLYVFYNTAGHINVATPSGDAFRSNVVAEAVALQRRPTEYRAGVYAAAGADANGNLYVAWADGRNQGLGNDILFAASDNGGASWTSPVRVNSDSGSADQLMPALAVAQDGTVTVAWLDNRNDPNNVNYDVYMARGKGARFVSNARVTSVSSNPYNDPRTQGTMIGDYFAAASGAGMTYIFWTDTRNNNEDIYMAPVPSLSSNQ